MMEFAAPTPVNAAPRSTQKSSQNWRIAVHIIGWLPLAEFTYKWLSHQLTANPIQYSEQFFGRAALNLLIATLAVTPLADLTRWNLTRSRRALGLYTFFYFALHFTTFAGLDYGFNWREMLRLTTEKPFIIVGSLAGVIIVLLAATSFQFWVKRLGKHWRTLHRTLYLAGGMVILHYAWSIKGSLVNLRGDIVGPLTMGIVYSFLLLLRIPALKKWIGHLKPGPSKG